ncbi:MAG: hypothetical protein KIT45_08005 [Fimbriimonadia bacterium]|nr:hypothetical protein [Fimbriimonadia bacterium]
MILKRPLLISLYCLPTATLLILSGGNFDLPGSQPNVDEGYQFQSAELCSYCHGNSQYAYDMDTGGVSPTFNTDHEPHFQWSGSMMAQSAKDPLFRAALTIAEQDVPGVGEFCWRCHSPSAWLEGRSVPFDGSNFTSNDLEGVSCDSCHRMVDPRTDEGQSLVDHPVPGFGNGMYVISPDSAKRGPRADAQSNHEFIYSPFHKKSEMCGTCHEVSNPVFATDRMNQPPHSYAQIARTFSEWQLSDFAKKGEDGSCQSCHMPATQGRSCAYDHVQTRPDLATHGFAGSNYWVPEILPLFWDYSEREWDALQKARYNAVSSLRKAAGMSVIQEPVKNKPMGVRVKNLTGHKLPTGDPEARRMWLHVQFLNANGQVIGESGRYDFNTGELIRDAGIKVYEAKPGVTGEGPTFHLARNDTFFKDNRIPPKGFKRSEFAARQMAPVGANYRDGQFWDDTLYNAPTGTARIRVTLYYQIIFKEYIEFLRDQNQTDDWGQRLYAAWLASDKAPPVAIATLTYPSDKNAPTRPGSPQAAALNTSRIRLHWQPSQDDDRVIYYEIWRKAPYEDKFRRIATTLRGETEFLDTGLHPNTTYQYYMHAIDSNQNRSARSAQVSATTLEF